MQMERARVAKRRGRRCPTRSSLLAVDDPQDHKMEAMCRLRWPAGTVVMFHADGGDRAFCVGDMLGSECCSKTPSMQPAKMTHMTSTAPSS
jgi:hypothetical protein